MGETVVLAVSAAIDTRLSIRTLYQRWELTTVRKTVFFLTSIVNIEKLREIEKDVKLGGSLDDNDLTSRRWSSGPYAP
jgi:hypothetical protein